MRERLKIAGGRAPAELHSASFLCSDREAPQLILKRRHKKPRSPDAEHRDAQSDPSVAEQQINAASTNLISSAASFVRFKSLFLPILCKDRKRGEATQPTGFIQHSVPGIALSLWSRRRGGP